MFSFGAKTLQSTSFGRFFPTRYVQVTTKFVSQASGSDRIRYWLQAFVLLMIVGNNHSCSVLHDRYRYYKYRQKINSADCIWVMASAHPLRLKDYCKQNNIDLFDLSIKCIFCDFSLTLIDCASFHEKALCLLWRHEKVYAACVKCLRVSARLERERHTQCAVKCSILDSVVGRPIEALLMRCFVCYQVISESEKHECVALNRDALLIRGTWRTLCRECREHEGW